MALLLLAGIAGFVIGTRHEHLKQHMRRLMENEK